ncbi:hypothetical protein C8P66_101323 [Humitalea rosea]|uniref:Inner membrane protein n=1 Tax=Humitalea rosea TaxID=990373 RepID=A0A2W7IUI6_9PROT|nr:hypothetical protein [Humitalea rosea]PZW51104.1 hypothetical protein C8P66_101323 [Humitalea rosea]
MADPAPPPAGAPAPPARAWDPAILPILAAAAVLAAAIGWLMFSPRSEPMNPVTDRMVALEQRVAAAETRLAADPAALAALSTRVAAAEAAAQSTSARPADSGAGDAVAALNERLSSIETLARSTAARPAGDPAAAAAMVERLTAATNRLQGLEAADGAAGARIGQIADRIAEAERAIARIGALDQRLTALETSVPGRISAVEAQIGSRATALENTLGARIGAVEGTTSSRATEAEAQARQRLAALEQRLTGKLGEAGAATARLEARVARLAQVDGLRLALNEGRALQPALAGLESPPAALQQYATTPPPTEAALRQRFEDAARAARAAADAPAQSTSPLEAATSRLAGLITIRRGEQVVWGDDSAAELERARVALASGDLTEALARVAALPAPARTAMAPWVTEVEALRAARAALATLAGG